MAAAVEWDEAATRICLEGEITIASAAELKALFLRTVEAGKPIEISLQGVASMDAIGAQLLWASGRAAVAAGLTYQLKELADASFLSGLREAGIALDDWNFSIH